VNRQRRPTWTELRALLGRPPRAFLIVRRHDANDAPWEFPSVRLPPRAAAEDALRRHCQSALGVIVDDAIPLPAFDYSHGTHVVTYLCYYCPVDCDHVLPLEYAAVRWVDQNQLAAYVIDAPGRTAIQHLPASDPKIQMRRNRSRP